jgi:phosphate ABC transporter phosphate-binding protein
VTPERLPRAASGSLAGLFVVLFTLVLPVGVATAADTTYVPISGAGSTWSANAIQQWAANVQQFGMTVNFQATGSSDGRTQFTNNTVDFGVSEIPYGLTDNGVTDTLPKRSFAYMPIVAGGTSFMYNLKIGGQRVTQLRLSGENITKIFTGVITNWADPAIKAENPGLNLPARKIVPVVRSDGSGTTAQFTLFMSKKYASLWDAYCVKAGRTVSPCGLTSQYPTVAGSGFVAQAGSTGVAGYASQTSSEGAITYVEYSYALNAGFPVVKLLNQAGYYTSPKASNVAVGLLGAKINTDTTSKDYLTQNLDGVYGNADPRAYPLSSYSYMIIPTALDASGGSFSAAKGNTLGAFSYYFLCEGQKFADRLGYSPLPINLVQAGIDQVKRIPGVVAESIDIKRCNNPTFSADGTNTLAKTAPQPAACDKSGPAQCGTAVEGAAGGGGTKTNPPKAGTTPSTAPGTNPSGQLGTVPSLGAPSLGSPLQSPGVVPPLGSDGSPAPGAPAASGGVAPPGSIDPDTGQQVGTVAARGANVPGTTVTLAADYADSGVRSVLMVVSVLALLGAAVGPPAFARRMAAARGGAGPRAPDDGDGSGAAGGARS